MHTPWGGIYQTKACKIPPEVRASSENGCFSYSRSPACCRGRRPAEWVLFQRVLKFEKRSIRVGMRPSIPRVKVRKCAELRKNMQLSYCKSDQHIKLFLWLHPCASIKMVNMKKWMNDKKWRNGKSVTIFFFGTIRRQRLHPPSTWAASTRSRPVYGWISALSQCALLLILSLLVYMKRNMLQ